MSSLWIWTFLKAESAIDRIEKREAEGESARERVKEEGLGKRFLEKILEDDENTTAAVANILYGLPTSYTNLLMASFLEPSFDWINWDHSENDLVCKSLPQSIRHGLGCRPNNISTYSFIDSQRIWPDIGWVLDMIFQFRNWSDLWKYKYFLFNFKILKY